MQQVSAAPKPGEPDSKAAWFERIDEIGEELGYYQPLGDRHGAFFVDDGPVLLVTFESADSIRAGSPQQLPMGHDIARAQGWSHLCLIADGPTWYRDPSVFGYVDRLVDDAFFEDFDRVVFYGAGMGGYAAAAFSVAAPGATVICVHPQATLDPRVTEWDQRFVAHRRLDFTSRYGFAPDMIEAAKAVHLLYDPERGQDAMHAALMTRPQVTKLRCRHMGGRLEQELTRMGVLPEMLRMAGTGELTPLAFHRLYRARRDHLPYLLRLLARLEKRKRHGLTLLLARWALSRQEHPRLRQMQAQAGPGPTAAPMPAPTTGPETAPATAAAETAGSESD